MHTISFKIGLMKLAIYILPEWINSNYIKLSKDRDHYYSKAHKTNNPQDWLMARKLRNQVNKLNKNLKKHYCNNAINENITDSKKLWCAIRKLIPKNVSAVSKDIHVMMKKQQISLMIILPPLAMTWLKNSSMTVTLIIMPILLMLMWNMSVLSLMP